MPPLPPPPSQSMFGMNTDSVASQLGDIGNSVLNAFGISPWGPQDPSKYKNMTDLTGSKRPGIAVSNYVNDPAKFGVGAELAPEGFYSHAEKVLNDTKQGIFSGDQLLGYLKGKGVKDEEIKWTGLKDLATRQKVSRAEALDAVRSGPQVGEQVLQRVAPESRIQKVGDPLPPGWTWDAHGFAVRGPNGEVILSNSAEQLNNALDDHMVDNQKHPQYDQPALNLPGPRSNYREILLTHQPSQPQGYAIIKDGKQIGTAATYQEIEAMPEFKTGDLSYAHLSGVEDASGKYPNDALHKFTESHWDQDNVLAHLRLNDRPIRRAAPARPGVGDVSGGLASHADEYQSDWANHAKAKGINPEPDPVGLAKLQKAQNEAADAYYAHTLVSPVDYYNQHVGGSGGGGVELEVHNAQKKYLRDQLMATTNNLRDYNDSLNSGVADAPYIRGSWGELAAKRHLIEAAKNPDVTDVTWTTGKQQADRYQLDKYYDDIRYDPKTKWFNAWKKEGGNSEQPHNVRNAAMVKQVEPQDLPNYLGKELSDKLLNSNPPDGPEQYNEVFNDRFGGHGGAHILRLQGNDIQVPNTGKRSFYDVQMPSIMKKLTKQEPNQVSIPAPSNYVPEGNRLQDMQNRPLGQSVDDFLAQREAAKGQGQQVWGIKMTPELRSRILREGFPLYSVAPLVAHEQTKSNPLPPPMMVNH